MSPSSQASPNTSERSGAAAPNAAASNASPLRQTWDNQRFFSHSGDRQIAAHLAAIKTEIAALATACQPFGQLDPDSPPDSPPDSLPETLIPTIRQLHRQRMDLMERLGNVSTFISCCLSVDAQDQEARSQKPGIQQLWADLDQALKPLQVWLMRTDDGVIAQLVADPDLAELEFSLRCDRQLRDQLLGVVDEQIISGLKVHGLHSWGNLYTELAGTLQVEGLAELVGGEAGESIGLAQAFNLLSSPERTTRELAWRGIQAAWTSRQETVATILNAINGWRLEETKQRRDHSPQHRELHYLDKSCHQSRIERATLEALLEAAYQQRAVGQRALKAMARALRIPQMAPWDLMAEAPQDLAAPATDPIPYERAIAIIAEAFGQLTPEMGEFVVMMAQNGWIDAEPTPNRATGAYCSGFAKPRQPRIFMTYQGTMGNVTTLAHELGHAWHEWVMRDLPQMQTSYPMTLAETASVFGETLVRRSLLYQAQTPAQKLGILWQDAESAAAFLVNIPARFEFEKRLVEARKQGFVVADQLKQMMVESWGHWYEDSLSEYDPMFWASKLHFSISSLGFYNYPYLFGYLFSLGIYAQKDHYGDRFNQLYIDILRDTGRMSAEAVVQQHLQQDIRQPEFWLASLKTVEDSVIAFESLVESR
jgi:oligoendopeptidase F